MSTDPIAERSYVLGTHDAEITRLGVQHSVWRASTLDLWRLGGLTTGQTVMDIGAGPGHAAVDLAEIVGPEGRIIAIERSRHFLSALQGAVHARALRTVEAVEADLLGCDWPNSSVDSAWCRWVLAFLPDPAKVLRGIAQALKPGGRLMIQEYYDYASWRLAPHSREFEAYVGKIIARWRASGGDVDIGLDLPRLLPDAGFEIELVRPVVMTPRMRDYAARWPMGFAREHLAVMCSTGALQDDEAAALAALLDRYEDDPEARVITPGVLQIIARKRA